jgi:hypothetical protein
MSKFCTAKNSVIPTFKDYNNPVVPQDYVDMRFSDSELGLFDTIAAEHSRTAGTPIDYYSLSMDDSVKDPLYNEPSQRAWKGPYRIIGWFEWPDATPEAWEEGRIVTFSCTGWLSRKILEDARVPVPGTGDVLRVWNTPYFNAAGGDLTASTNQDGSNLGYFFDVLNANDDGHLFDSAAFVGFKLTLNRRTQFAPERLVSPP